MLLWIKGGKWKALAANIFLDYRFEFAACALHCAVGFIYNKTVLNLKAEEKSLRAVAHILKAGGNSLGAAVYILSAEEKSLSADAHILKAEGNSLGAAAYILRAEENSLRAGTHILKAGGNSLCEVGYILSAGENSLSAVGSFLFYCQRALKGKGSILSLFLCSNYLILLN